jgi:integrase
MNDAQINAKLRTGIAGKYSVGDGLYFRVSKEGTGFFIVRYTINNKRREISLGKYNKLADGLSLSNAKIEASKVRAQVRDKIDPIAEKKRSKEIEYKTVNDVALDWLKTCEKRLKNPQIPARVYRKDISPMIGELRITDVNARDILVIIRKINDSGRPTVANDALIYCKQLFNHAIKLDLTQINPAFAFGESDAGGVEKSRDRTLSLDELKIVFKVMRENSQQFTRDNFLAFILLLCFGVRKGELIAATWSEFDFEKRIWELSGERTKTGAALIIPIPELIFPVLRELKIRACGSEYLFPSRRISKRRSYISDDTLNHALAKLFGNEGYIKEEKIPNILGDAGVPHFVIHDLRRTFRSLLAQQGVPPHIAEKCLNHKLKGVEGVYDRYDYLEERRKALTELAQQLTSFVSNPSREIEIISANLTL